MNGGRRTEARIKRLRDETGISPTSVDFFTVAANEPIKMLKIVSQNQDI
jgi:hypothetical protein